MITIVNGIFETVSASGALDQLLSHRRMPMSLSFRLRLFFKKYNAAATVYQETKNALMREFKHEQENEFQADPDFMKRFNELLNLESVIECDKEDIKCSELVIPKTNIKLEDDKEEDRCVLSVIDMNVLEPFFNFIDEHREYSKE